MRLDALRGFAVLVMVIDHMGGDDSWLYRISGHNHFFISAAEAFVFVSGLVMGTVYASMIARSGLKPALIKAARRVGLLYALSVLLSLGLALFSLELDLPWAPHWGKEGIVGFVMSLLTLHRTYYLTDVLLLYTLLVTCAMVVLPLLAARRWWVTLLVLAGSWGLWLAWQVVPQQPVIPWSVTDNEVFNFSAWQLLFMNALVIGYYRKSIGALLGKMRLSALYAILGLSGAIFASTIAFYLWTERNPGDVDSLLLAQLFEKANVSIGRVAVFTLFMVFAFTLLTVAWKPVQKGLGWLLLPLGQGSLNAYGLHIFFVAITTAILPGLLGDWANTTEANTASQLAVILLIWGVILTIKPAKAFFAQTKRALFAWLARILRLRGSSVVPTGSKRGVPQRAGLALAVFFIIITPLLLVGSLTMAGPLKRTLSDLNNKGRNTVVFVPTVVSGTPSASRGAKLEGLPADAATAGGTPVPSSSPLAADGQMMAMSLASTPQAGNSSNAASSSSTEQAAPVVLPAGAQTRTFQSASLGREMSYIIYLPPGYNTNTASRYPVLYMLHGIGGTNMEWVRYGLIGWSDQLMRANMIQQFIIVLPEGEESYWMDWANNGPKWGAYTAKDLVAEVDSHFRTVAKRESRAIGGISMGGHAALQLAINYPTVFGVVGSHSPSLHAYESAPQFFGDEAYFEAHDPASLFASHPEIARTFKLWIDDGKYDAWLPLITSFHQQLQTEGIKHEWHVYDGDTLTAGHTGEYWSTHIPDYLRFYSASFPKQ